MPGERPCGISRYLHPDGSHDGYGIPASGGEVFPAKQYGGLDTIKALAAPFPSMRFMPTGGINADNIQEYLGFDKIVACGAAGW